MTIYAIRTADHPSRPKNHALSTCDDCGQPVWLDAILATHYREHDVQCLTCQPRDRVCSLAECVTEALDRMRQRLAAHEAQAVV